MCLYCVYLLYVCIIRNKALVWFLGFVSRRHLQVKSCVNLSHYIHQMSMSTKLFSAPQPAVACLDENKCNQAQQKYQLLSLYLSDFNDF